MTTINTNGTTHNNKYQGKSINQTNSVFTEYKQHALKISKKKGSNKLWISSQEATKKHKLEHYLGGSLNQQQSQKLAMKCPNGTQMESAPNLMQGIFMSGKQFQVQF